MRNEGAKKGEHPTTNLRLGDAPQKRTHREGKKHK